MIESWILGLLGAGTVLAVGFAAVSLYFSTTRVPDPESVPALRAEVNGLRTTVADLTDRLEQWQRRDRVRRVREKAEVSEPEPVEPMDPLALKRELRRRAFGGNP